MLSVPAKLKALELGLYSSIVGNSACDANLRRISRVGCVSLILATREPSVRKDCVLIHLAQGEARRAAIWKENIERLV